MGSFDLFAPGSATIAVLVAFRLTGLMLVAPVFSAKTLPVMLRTALLVLFAVLLQPAARTATGSVPVLSVASVLGELLVGFAIGLGAALVVGAAEAAGELIAIQTGLSGAALLDPLNGTSAPVLANFMSLFAVTLLLALNAHLGMLEALAASLRAVPVGSPMDLHRGIGAMLSLTGTLFTIGLRFAAPVIAVVMIGNAALAVLSRAAPQLNILSVAFPLQIGLGLFALGVAVPFMAMYFGDWPSRYDGQLTTLFNAFVSSPSAPVGVR